MDELTKKRIKRFLRNICNIEGSVVCVSREFCSKRQDCGVCRFEYMEKKGWLRVKENEFYREG